MKEENLIKDKAYNFALEIIKLYKYLSNEKKEFVLSKQILRSGTSIRANIYPVKFYKKGMCNVLHLCFAKFGR